MNQAAKGWALVTGGSGSLGAAIAAGLARDGFDVIITGRKPSLPGLTDRDLGAVRHVICASPKYFQRFGRPKTPHDLREHSCLVNMSTPKGWPFQGGSRQILVEVKGALSSNSPGRTVTSRRPAPSTTATR